MELYINRYKVDSEMYSQDIARFSLVLVCI